MSPTESCLYTDFFASCLLNRKRYTLLFFQKKEGSKGVSIHMKESIQPKKCSTRSL